MGGCCQAAHLLTPESPVPLSRSSASVSHANRSKSTPLARSPVDCRPMRLRSQARAGHSVMVSACLPAPRGAHREALCLARAALQQVQRGGAGVVAAASAVDLQSTLRAGKSGRWSCSRLRLGSLVTFAAQALLWAALRTGPSSPRGMQGRLRRRAATVRRQLTLWTRHAWS